LLSELQLKVRTQILFNGLSRYWADYYILIYTRFQELMKSVGTHGSLSLLLVMEVKETSAQSISSPAAISDVAVGVSESG